MGRESDVRKQQLGQRSDISIQNPNRYADVSCPSLGPWLEGLIAELAPDVSSFAVRFIGDRAMRRLNSEFRDRETTTDVLSFPGEPSPDGRHLGDVAISVPVARRQAAEAGSPMERELRTLVLHGVLHCLGYDHERDGGEMRRLEGRLRQRWVDDRV